MKAIRKRCFFIYLLSLCLFAQSTLSCLIKFISSLSEQSTFTPDDVILEFVLLCSSFIVYCAYLICKTQIDIMNKLNKK